MQYLLRLKIFTTKPLSLALNILCSRMEQVLRCLKHISIYRKIPNISPGLVGVRKHILGGYIQVGLYSGGGLYSRGHIFGGNIVLVSRGVYILGGLYSGGL